MNFETEQALKRMYDLGVKHGLARAELVAAVFIDDVVLRKRIVDILRSDSVTETSEP